MAAQYSLLKAIVRIVCVLLAAAAPFAASAQDGLQLAGPENLKLYGDIRIVAADGEPSWPDDGFGKLRYGGGRPPDGSALHTNPDLAEVGLVWQPQLGWSLSGTVVALVQGNRGRALDAGLSEAFLSLKPLGDGPVRFSARAGLMWPPVSIEHGGPEWAVTDTITPSAIGSWISEEVKVVGVEAALATDLGAHRISATLGAFDLNDTSGTLISFRGWSLNDRKALAFRKQPLPPLSNFAQQVQPQFTHPLLDLDPGLFRRPGYYAKLAWSLPAPVRIEAFRYDNNGNPDALNADLEWGWRTQFWSLGAVAKLGQGYDLRVQGLTGRTHMGFDLNGTDWVDTRFRAGFAMITRRFAKGSVSVRVDLFDTRNIGSAIDSEDDDNGTAFTLAAQRRLNDRFSVLAEFVHVNSQRPARVRSGLASNQSQNQLQLALRGAW